VARERRMGMGITNQLGRARHQELGRQTGQSVPSHPKKRLKARVWFSRRPA